MHRAAKLVSFASRDIQLLADTSADVGAVLSASGRSVITGGNDGVVLDYDSTEGFAQTGASGSDRLSYVKVIIVFINAFFIHFTTLSITKI